MNKSHLKTDKILILFGCLMFGLLLSCNGRGNANTPVQKIEKTDSCQSDTDNRYEIYIPKRTRSNEKLPLLVILDSHGNGELAINKFKYAADLYPAVLAASDLVKNDFTGYKESIQALVNDVRQKYPVGKTLFLTGFSGGARMALNYALTHPADGLILCGALANAKQIKALQGPLISISGTDDFNFIETAQYLFNESSAPENLRIELTEGTHEWPDSLMLANAFALLRLSCRSKELPTLPKSQMETFCNRQHFRIDSLQKQGDYLKAALIARNTASTGVLDKDQSFASLYNHIKTHKKYTDALNRLRKNLTYEIRVRQSYLEAFTTQDSLWWKKEIETNRQKTGNDPDIYARDMYKRIKGFWGIACYTLGNRAIRQQDTETLNKILSVYRMLEPENPDMYYFSSFPYYWKGDKKMTLFFLKKALEKGFTDTGRLQKDFPPAIRAAL